MPADMADTRKTTENSYTSFYLEKKINIIGRRGKQRNTIDAVMTGGKQKEKKTSIPS